MHMPAHSKPSFMLAMALLLALIPCAAMAHSPADMALSYDPPVGELSVTITHGVENPAIHFVYLVEIEKDGRIIERKEYQDQPTSGTFTYRYPVSALPGETITVTASCNLAGSITRQLVITGAAGGEPSSAPSLPLWHYHAILVVLGLICFLVAAGMVQLGHTIGGWYTYHKSVAALGGIFTIIAFLIPFYLVFLAGGPSSLLPHALLGILIILLVIGIIILGIARERSEISNPSLRSTHLWAGRLLIVLMILNLFYRFVLMGII